jgi:hypothetical protein
MQPASAGAFLALADAILKVQGNILWERGDAEKTE